MKRHTLIKALLLLCLSLPMSPATAGPNDPLFVNLTADEPHRANMGITFGRMQMQQGHPLTIFLNDRAVLIGARVNAAKFAMHQKMLTDLMAAGAIVLICPMCMKHYGVSESDLLPGIRTGSPEVTGAALFRDGTKTMTW